MIGRVLSHYRIVGSLGAGGMGVIYRAEDSRLGRAVALKFVPDELAHDRQAVDRLRAEARAASALNHPNICTVYDIGEDDGRPFIVMELLTGRNLRELLAAGALKVHQLVDIGIQIADALDAAHAAGIIHRDIKPPNIFVTDRNQAKLLDFGVAKSTEVRGLSGTTASTGGAADLTRPGSTVGTAAYMSPEQATGETLDGRTDLFSLGVVLYEAATGQHPFTGKTAAVVLSAILNRAAVAPTVLKPQLPQHLQEIIQNCLEKDRELRYQSAADLRADLRRLRRDLESGQSRVEVTARQPALPPAGKAPIHQAGGRATEASAHRRRRLAGLGAALAITALLAAIGVSLVWRAEPAAPASPALSDADVQSRIDQAVANLGTRLAEQQAQQRQEAARGTPPPAAAAAPATPPPVTRRTAPPASAEAPASAAEAPRGRSAPPKTSSPVVSPPATGSGAPPANRALPIERNLPLPAGASPSLPVAAPPPARPPAEPPRPATDTDPAARAGARAEAAKAAAPTAEEDEAAMRQILAAYARAIENKDIALFRSVKPNLSPEEQRRLEDGFRAVTRQTVTLTVLSIDRRGQQATVVSRRSDTIEAGGRRQTVDGRQTFTLERAATGWVITEIR